MRLYAITKEQLIRALTQQVDDLILAASKKTHPIETGMMLAQATHAEMKLMMVRATRTMSA